MAKTYLTAARLRELLSYNPKSGTFTRLTTSGKGPRCRSGAVLGNNQNSTSGYFTIMLEGKRYSAHRLAWLHFYGVFPDHCIDHIDGNPRNNSIANLRDVTIAVNTQNQKTAQRSNKCGLLGVSKHKCGRFVSGLWVDGKSKYLGLYDTPEEAHEVYLKAKRALHPGCVI